MVKKEEGFQLLSYLIPIASYVPKIKESEKTVPLKDKLIWTLLALFIFLVSSQIPLFGIIKQSDEDPFLWSRIIMASNRGSLMELGINPIVSAGMVIQVLTGAKLISTDNNNPSDKKLIEILQKLIAIIIALFESITYVFSGIYGEPETLGVTRIFLIVIQLMFAAIIVILLDEALTSGYGIVSGISLFIATNVCEELLWKSFSPLKNNDEYEGVIIAFFQTLFKEKSLIKALRYSFFRDSFSNLTGLLSTIIVFMIVNFFQGFQINLAIHNQTLRGHNEAYPIKLFYTSNMPVILQSTLLSNFFFISKLLYSKFKNWSIIRYLGSWSDINGQSIPISGLAYLLHAPNSLSVLLNNPFKAVFYILFMLISCAVFSRTWIEFSGNGPKEVYKSLKNQKISAYGGSERLLEKRLNKYIPIAATVGGACIGVLSLLADFLGAIGSGTGILLTCGIVFEFYETYTKEVKSGQSVF